MSMEHTLKSMSEAAAAAVPPPQAEPTQEAEDVSVNLNEWLQEPTLAEFLLGFRQSAWPDVVRSTCLLGVLCLKRRSGEVHTKEALQDMAAGRGLDIFASLEGRSAGRREARSSSCSSEDASLPSPPYSPSQAAAEAPSSVSEAVATTHGSEFIIESAETMQEATAEVKPLSAPVEAAAAKGPPLKKTFLEAATASMQPPSLLVKAATVQVDLQSPPVKAATAEVDSPSPPVKASTAEGEPLSPPVKKAATAEVEPPFTPEARRPSALAVAPPQRSPTQASPAYVKELSVGARTNVPQHGLAKAAGGPMSPKASVYLPNPESPWRLPEPVILGEQGARAAGDATTVPPGSWGHTFTPASAHRAKVFSPVSAVGDFTLEQLLPWGLQTFEPEFNAAVTATCTAVLPPLPHLAPGTAFPPATADRASAQAILRVGEECMNAFIAQMFGPGGRGVIHAAAAAAAAPKKSSSAGGPGTPSSPPLDTVHE